MFCHRRTKWKRVKDRIQTSNSKKLDNGNDEMEILSSGEWANLPYPQQNPTKNQFIIVTEVYWHETQKSLTRTPKQQLRLLTDFFRESATHSRKLLRNNNKYLELFWVQADIAISEASITTSLECQEGIKIQKGIFGRNTYYFRYNCNFEYPVSMVKMASFRPKYYKCCSSNRSILMTNFGV